MAALAERIEEEIVAEIEADRLDLPTLPEVALQIRDTAEDPDVTAKSLAAVISQDPGLAARMVRIANSPVYRGTTVIDSLDFAVARLGVTYAGNLATGMAMRQLFQATSDLIDRRLRAIWNRAVQVAGTTTVLARHFTRLRPDQASLAGLTHSIGMLPVLTWAEMHPALLRDGLTLDAVLDRIQGPLGTKILQSWEFPEHLSIVPSEHLRLDRKAPRTDYVDLVTVAVLQDLAGTRHPIAQLDWSHIQAFKNLGLDPDTEGVEYEAISAEAEQTSQALA